MTTYTYDGKTFSKAVGFGAAISDKYYSSLSDVVNAAVVGNLTAMQAYDVVSYVFRCVNIRAHEVSRMPRVLLNAQGEDVSQQDGYESLTNITRLLFMLEASRCVTGAAYALIEGNPSGYNPSMRWVPSPSVQPKHDATTKRLAYFYRQDSTPHEIQLDEIVYLWNANLKADNAPGLGESQVGLSAASMLYALDAFASGYFNGGAVPVTIVPEDPIKPDEQIEKTQNFWNRRVAGVGRAWRYIVMRMRQDNKPFTIGSNVKDTQAVELSTQKQNDIAVAHGISPNIVNGGYKYATADSEYLNFIAGEIIPRVEETFDALNKQFYSRLGYKLVAQPEKLEIMQAAQLMQSQAVTTVVGEPVMRRDEGREILGLKPEPKRVNVPAAPAITPATSGAPIVPASPQISGVAANVTTLNGAQISSAIDVLNGVSAGTVAEEVAIELLVSLGIERERAQAMASASKKLDVSSQTPIVSTSPKSMIDESDDTRYLADALFAAAKALEQANG